MDFSKNSLCPLNSNLTDLSGDVDTLNNNYVNFHKLGTYPTNKTTTLSVSNGVTTDAFDKSNTLTLARDAICLSNNISYNFSASYTYVNGEEVAGLLNNNALGTHIKTTFFAASGSVLKVRVSKSQGANSAAETYVKIRYL